MKIQITGRNFDIGDALRSHTSERCTQIADKYFANALSSHVTLTRDAGLFRAECIIHVGTGIDFNTEARDADPYAAVDLALTRLEKRLRRYKRRLRDHHTQRSEPALQFGAADYMIRASEETHEDDEPSDLSPVIIAESRLSIGEVTVGEAVMQMDVSERPFLVFKNGANGRINVVYRRDDGNIGWIDPDFIEQAGG